MTSILSSERLKTSFNIRNILKYYSLKYLSKNKFILSQNKSWYSTSKGKQLLDTLFHTAWKDKRYQGMSMVVHDATLRS